MRRFGAIQALAGVSCEAAGGEIVGLLGPNGAGKSTLLRAATTLEQLDSGRIEVCGVDVAARPAEARRHLGYAGQEAALDKLMTGREFLRFQGALVHLAPAAARQRAAELLERLGLAGAADRLVEGYSGGMKRRLDLAASLMHRPRLLILDEPSGGLDYQARRSLWDLLRGFREEGTALLLATHDFEEAGELCDRVLLMSRGKVAASGPPAQLCAGLGSWLISAALHEHPRSGDADRLAAWFAGIPGSPLPSDPRRSEYCHVLPPEERDGQRWVAAVQERARLAGATLYALTWRQPGLRDVYLARVGEPVETNP